MTLNILGLKTLGSLSLIHHIVSLIRTELAAASDSSQITPANTEGEGEQRSKRWFISNITVVGQTFTVKLP